MNIIIHQRSVIVFDIEGIVGCGVALDPGFPVLVSVGAMAIMGCWKHNAT